MSTKLPRAADPDQVPLLLRQRGRSGVWSVACSSLLWQRVLKGSETGMWSSLSHTLSSWTLSTMSQGTAMQLIISLGRTKVAVYEWDLTFSNDNFVCSCHCQSKFDILRATEFNNSSGVPLNAIQVHYFLNLGEGT